MLKFFGIAFLAHFVVLFAFIYLDPAVSSLLTNVALVYFLWPLFILPSGGGGSHGGELFVAIFSIPINSLIWAYALWTLKRIRSNP